MRFLHRDVFRFAEHQKKATHGLGYLLKLTKKSDSAVSNKDNATNILRIKNDSIERYVSHYNPSTPQQPIFSKQIVNKVRTELQYVERSVFMTEVKTQTLQTFELQSQEGINISKWIIVGFQQRDRQESQKFNNDTFYRPPVTSACIIGTEKYPDSSIF